MDSIKSDIEHAITVLNKVKKVYCKLSDNDDLNFRPGETIYGYKYAMPIANLIQAVKELQRMLDNPKCLEEYGSLK